MKNFGLILICSFLFLVNVDLIAQQVLNNEIHNFIFENELGENYPVANNYSHIESVGECFASEFQSEIIDVDLDNEGSNFYCSLNAKSESLDVNSELYFIRCLFSEGNWGDWELFSRSSHGLAFKDDFNSEFNFSTEPLSFNSSIISYQLRILSENSLIGIKNVEIHFFTQHSSDVSEIDIFEGASLKVQCPCPDIQFVSRSGWGCPDLQNSPSWLPVTTSVSHIIVHHAAGYGNPPYNQQVLNIWYQHSVVNGWGDIGYNWLIDPDGVLYQGRAWLGDNDNVIGAHMCSCNSNKMGVCLLGDFTNSTPTAAAYNTLVELLAWKCCDFNIDPQGSGNVVSKEYSSQQCATTCSVNCFTSLSCTNTSMERISGHRDGCKDNGLFCTECPGNLFYPQFPQLRSDVQEFIISCGASSGEDIFFSDWPVLYDGYPGDQIQLVGNQCYTGDQLDADLPSIRMNYYFSNECDLNGGETYIGTDLSGIGSDDLCNSESIYFTIPNVSSGMYYIILEADADGTVVETNEANNILCIPIFIWDSPIEEDVYFSSIPSDLFGTVGSSMSFDIEQCYLGPSLDSELPSLDLEYYFSVDCQLDFADLFLTSAVSGIGSDDPCDWESPNFIVPEFSDGDYFIIVVADSDDEVQEINETNNNVCIPIQIVNEIVEVDFGISNASISMSSVDLGETIELGFDADYILGDDDLIFVFSGYYLSSNCIFDPGVDILLTTEASEIGNSNLSQHESSYVQIPTNISEGNYYILFVVDNEFLISESNENNNLICLPIAIGTDCLGPAIPVFSNGNLITCPNGTVSINLVDNNSSYFWGLPAGWQCVEGCNSNSAIILPNASGTLAISGVNECSEVSSPLYLNIDIYEIFANAGEDITVCGQQTFQLVGQGGVEYSWSPGAYLDNPSSNFTEGEISQTTTFLLNVIDENGCTSMDEVTVYVESPEVSTSPMGLIEICQGEEIEISASEGQEYLWSTGEETQSIMVGMEGTYYCTILNPFDCIGEFNTPMVVVEYTEPQIIDLVINGNLLIAPVIGIGYNWYWNELPIAAFQDSQTCDVTLFGEGSYYVIVEQENGCLMESQVLNYLSVDDLNIENWKVYPNPAAESFLISGIKTYDQIYIFNSIGELIQYRTNTRDTLQINVSEWSVGLYEIVVSNDKTLSSKKLLIAR